MSATEESSVEITPSSPKNTNGKTNNSDHDEANGQYIPHRRPSANLAEFLQNADGSTPTTPKNSRQNSLRISSQQNSFEYREDEEITDVDAKVIADLITSSINGSNGEDIEANGKNGEASDNSKKDEHDAWGFSRPTQSHQALAKMPCAKDAECYNMKHKTRGIAVIFNHKNFDHRLGLKMRNGTDADRDNLRITLRQLEFEVRVYNDLSFKEIEGVIEELSAQTNHSDADCILISVLSHGELGILYACDHAYKPDRLWTQFNAEKCPSLAGKPKMFMIQACQGDQLDAGVKLVSNTETDASSMSYKIPSHADFLIVYSTIPGFYSWRNTTAGSWFVQALCYVLQREGRNRDFLSCLTMVARRVAFEFQSNTPGDYVMHEKKQIPCITSMLTRDIIFAPK